MTAPRGTPLARWRTCISLAERQACLEASTPEERAILDPLMQQYLTKRQALDDYLDADRAWTEAKDEFMEVQAKVMRCATRRQQAKRTAQRHGHTCP